MPAGIRLPSVPLAPCCSRRRISHQLSGGSASRHQQRNPERAAHGPGGLCSAPAKGASPLISRPPPLTPLTLCSATISFWRHRRWCSLRFMLSEPQDEAAELLISHARLPREAQWFIGGMSTAGGSTSPVSQPLQWLHRLPGWPGPDLARLARNNSFFFSIKHYSQSTQGGPAPWAEPLLAQGGSGGPGTGMPQLAGAMSPSLSQHPVAPRPVLRAGRKRSTGKKRGAKGAEGCRDAATRPVLPQGLGCHPQTWLPQALLGMPRSSPPGITETVLGGGINKLT